MWFELCLWGCIVSFNTSENVCPIMLYTHSKSEIFHLNYFVIFMVFFFVAFFTIHYCVHGFSFMKVETTHSDMVHISSETIRMVSQNLFFKIEWIFFSQDFTERKISFINVKCCILWHHEHNKIVCFNEMLYAHL